MRLLRRTLHAVCTLGLAAGFVVARAQTAFNTVVVFGDSLSDTGNIAHLTQSATLGLVRYPGDYPVLGLDYTDGRFTDGKDTQPPAQAYFGVWIEQLAGSFAGKPAVKDSLDGGTNFAYGDATTGPGTTTISEGPVSITVHNMGQQLTDYLSQSPAPVPNAQTLYVLWGGANDVFEAVGVAVSKGLDPVAAANLAANTAVQNELSLIQQLVTAGATNFMVPNLPPLGDVPDYATNPGAAALNGGAATFQTALAQGITALVNGYTAKGVKVSVYQPDIFTEFNTIFGKPATLGLGNVTIPAQNVTGSPDTYLFWDGEHPTTTGHHFAAAVAANLLTPLVGSTTVLTVPGAVLSGQAATLSAKVSGSASGGAVPTGLVTFFSGTTVIGSAALDATGTGTASFSGVASGSPYSVTAVYAGDTTYGVSASAAQPFAVLGTPVATSTSLNVGILSTGTGQEADLTATVTPAVTTYGSVPGTVTFYDGTTTVGTGTLSKGMATFTTAALAVGTHSFTASYAASGVFAASTSSAVSEPIVSPGFTPAAAPSSLTIKDGGTGTTQLSARGTGGFTGALTLSCGTLPAHITCSFSSTTYSVPDPLTNVVPSPVTLTIGTSTSAAELLMRPRPGAWSAPEIFSATLLFPGLAGMMLMGFRRKRGLAGRIRLTALVAVLAAGAALGLAGCGNNPDAAKGTYMIPVVFTPASGSSVPAATINVSVTVD